MTKIKFWLLCLCFWGVHVQAADFTNFLGMQFVNIPKGSFYMGSCVPVDGKSQVKAGLFGLGSRSVCLSGGKVDLKAEPDELPQHLVQISKSFQIGIHEVTRKQYVIYLNDNGKVITENFKKHNSHGEDSAVVWVSWFQIQSFLDWLNLKKPTTDQRTYRLPTEAEWEYVARSGTTTPYFFGEESFQITRFAWIIKDSQQFGEVWSQPVAKKRANPWGLFDIYGNAWEWVQDVYQADYYQNSPNQDPQGPSTGAKQVVRGCSLYSSAKNCRSANRHYFAADRRDGTIGFRLVRQ